MPRKNDDEKKPRAGARKTAKPAKPPKGSNKAGGTRKGRAAAQSGKGKSKGATGARSGSTRGTAAGRKPSAGRSGAPRRASGDRYEDRKPAARGGSARSGSTRGAAGRGSSTGRTSAAGRSGAPRRASGDRYEDRKPAPRSGSTRSGGAPRRAAGGRSAAPRKAAWKGDNRKDERREERAKREIPKGFGPYLRTEPERERRPDHEFAPRPAAPLRTKGVRGKGARKAEGVQKPGRVGRARRLRKGAPPEVRDEIFKVGGRRSQRLFDAVAEASTAFAEGRDKDAARILKPVRDEIPNAASVRELYGLALYRSGRYAQAAKELEAFVELTGSVEQHPVLMDCARAQRQRDEVRLLWEELGSVSPSSALMMEGRIVLAGSMADSGDVRGAIELLEKKNGDWKRPQEHHARFWYALGDLYERAGELARARTYFLKVRKYDASYADVAERLSGLR